MPEERGYRLCPIDCLVGLRPIKSRPYNLGEEIKPTVEVFLSDVEVHMLLKRITLITALAQ